MAVVEVVPLVIGHRLAESSVMAEPYVTEMVGDGEAVVDQLVLLTLLSAQNEIAHVEAVQREVDLGLEFGSTDTEAIFTLSSLESLKSDNQNWRSAVNLKSLVGGNVVFALTAVPFVVFI